MPLDKITKISIVIPTYNEAVREAEMKAHLTAIKSYFKRHGYPYEIIIVLDGPTDNTRELVYEYQKDNEHINIIDRHINKGKGYSIREGMLQATGDIILFTDMDGATPIHMLDDFLPKFEEGFDIIIGSREIEKQKYIKKHQPKWKEYFGNFGNILIQHTLGLKGIKDTQCGFKAFTKQVVTDVMPRTKLNRWGIDFEILSISKKLGYKMTELPVEWTDSGHSLVGFKGYFQTLKDLFHTKWLLLTGAYKQ